MKKTVVKKPRNANLDLLRIFSMILIILLHSIDHSGVLEQAPFSSTAINFWVMLTYMLTQVCVNLYVLISGYFLVKSKFRLQKLVALWLEVAFYSFVIKLVFMITGYNAFSIPSLMSCLVPVFTGRYWFITIYFGLYLVFPFLNILINAMNKRQHTMLNITLFALMSVMVSIYPSFKGMNSGAGWGLAWFVVLYFAAAWFRLYFNRDKKFEPLCVWLALSLVVAFGYVFIGEKIAIARAFFSNMYRYDSVIAYISSLALLALFINVKIKSAFINKIIIFIAPSILGVYLIHAHASFSPWSWEFLNMPQYMDTLLFPVIQIGVVLAIFAFCVVIDIVRRYTIGRVESSKFIVNICDKIEDKARKLSYKYFE